MRSLARLFCLAASFLGLNFLAQAVDLRFQAVPAGTKLEDLPKVLPGVVETTDALTDAGDFYLTPSQGKVGLLRSTNSLAVEFTSQTSTHTGLQKLRMRKGMPAQTRVGEVRRRGGRKLQILRASVPKQTLDRQKMLAETAVDHAFPVLVDRQTGMRMILTDEILVRFRADILSAQVAVVAKQFGLELATNATIHPLNVTCFKIKNARRADALAVCRQVGVAAGVLWAQPNFVREIRRSLQPANPFFPQQQALANRGQNHAVAGADVKAVPAWDRTTGRNSVVIAILDDGVDTAHPALRIFTNPGESGDGKETNLVDDDGNGLIDDVHGWDFANGDNNPSPTGGNGHGTGCAGIAAARFGVMSPTAGVAPDCTILPVKIADDNGDFTTDQIIGDALLYAARYADVLSNSWGGGSASPYIEAAIDYATTQGRSGRGCPTFFATGNSASSWYQGGGRARIFLNGFGGDYYIGFYYLQGSARGGENAVRLDNICLLESDGYTHKTGVLADEDFENFAPGWFVLSSFGVTSNWDLSATNPLTGTGGLFSAKSPSLRTGQVAVLASPFVTLQGDETLAFAVSVSLPADTSAGVYFVLLDSSFAIVAGAGPLNGVPEIITATTYPASYGNAIAVGAATDCDLRSDFSQYDGKVDFLASSNGGWNDIATLDPLGAVGWTAENYKMNFGGTSAATPLAAGIAALMLSENPRLTATEVRAILRNTCDKVGGVTYDVDGKNPFYGYGRVNANRAVGSALPILSIADAAVPEMAVGTESVATFHLSLSDPAIREVTVDFATLDRTALAGTHYEAASGVVTFPAGTMEQTVNVAVHGVVPLARPNLSFLVQLNNAGEAAIGRNPAVGKITALDSDWDGMPNFWENEQQYNPADANDAAPDDDADGFSNGEEFLAGTNPHENASHPGITQVFSDASGVHVEFSTEVDRYYTIEATDDLAANDWQILEADLVGTGTSWQVLDTTSFALFPQRFYRVQAQP